jgi:Asp-tRNA(Asn)/Glu-tRNA(Gln) amidotransferase B subunit
MSHTFTPSIGPAKGTEITISDKMFNIINNRNTAGGTKLQESIENSVANNTYNGEQIELFQNTQLSHEITKEFINSSWGSKHLVDFAPVIQQQIIQKANENHEEVQMIMEEALEENIDNTLELLQFLLQKANEHPDAVQEIIDALSTLS